MKKQSIAWALSVSAVLFAAACAKEEAKPESEHQSSAVAAAAAEPAHDTPAAAAPDLAKAKEAFNARCATCHGTEGKGNGPGAVALNPKPRNYHDKEWQGKVTDEDIKKTILYGGAAVGKSPMMPASPDLESQSRTLDGLVQVVREFGKS